MHTMPPIYITFLNRLDIEALALSDDEIIAAIETSLAAQGRGQTVIEPRVHLAPGLTNGHFNVLRGAIAAPVDRAGIKVVGDFVDNYKLGYPSELGVVLLLDPRMGAPRAILDGAGITDMRTGAMTAVGASDFSAQDLEDPGPYWRRARLVLLERKAARPAVRLSMRSASIPSGRRVATHLLRRAAVEGPRQGKSSVTCTTGAPCGRGRRTSSSRPRGLGMQPEPLLSRPGMDQAQRLLSCLTAP